MKNLFRFITFLFFTLLLFTGCQEDEELQPEGYSVITTVAVTFKNANSELIYTWQDPDGPGGSAGTGESILLNAQMTYDVSMELFDESGSSSINATQEIVDMSELFYMIFENQGVAANFARIDTDINGLPVGLDSQITTFGSGSGIYRFELKRDVDKANPFTTGTSEFNAVFPITVQ